MARTRKKRSELDQKFLIPHVAEETPTEVQKPLSEQARHAEEAVELLVRDLFGEKAKESAVAEPATVTEPIAEPHEEIGTDKEAPATQMLQQLAADEEPITAFSLDTQDELLGQDAEEALSLKEQVESSTEEFRLLLDMDYEDELGNAIGFEKIRAYHERELNGKTSSAKRGKDPHIREFERAEKDTEVRFLYTKQKTGHILRLVLSLVLFVLVCLYENAALMAKLPGNALDGSAYPVTYILFGVQLLVLGAALFYKPLCAGFLQLTRFSPIASSVPFVAFVGALFYHIALLFLPHVQAPALYLSPVALCFVMLAVSQLLNWYRESLAFDVVSARRQKYAILPRICVGGREGSAKDSLLSDKGRRVTHYVRPVDFVRNYFNNTARMPAHYRNLGAFLLLALSAGFCVALSSFALGGRAVQIAETAFVAFLLCMPALSLFVISMPMFFAAVLRLKGKGAIVGEMPIDTCAQPATLVLPDGEIFVAMEHEHFRLANEGDAHRVSVLSRALLERVQSPLAEAFSVDVASRLDPALLTLTQIDALGVAAEIGEKHTRVLIGTPDYLARFGLEVKSRARDIKGELYARMLAVAVDDRVAAQFWVRYTIAEDFKRLLRDMDHAGIPLTVISKDPCVRTDVFARLFPRLRHRVQVMKPSVKELPLRASRVDSTVVAVGTCKEVARTFVTCRRVRRIGIRGKLLQILSAMAGGVLGFSLALQGREISAFSVTLWLLLWNGAYTLLSYFALRRASDDI